MYPCASSDGGDLGCSGCCSADTSTALTYTMLRKPLRLHWPQIEYTPGAELAGATPAFVPALLVFNEVMRHWHDDPQAAVTVAAAHAHVVRGQHSVRLWF